jgi:hypothetical protein
MACTQSTTAFNTQIVPDLMEFAYPDDPSTSSVADARAFSLLNPREQDEVDMMLCLADDGTPCWNCMKNVATFTRGALPFCSDECGNEYLCEMSFVLEAELAEAA